MVVYVICCCFDSLRVCGRSPFYFLICFLKYTEKNIYQIGTSEAPFPCQSNSTNQETSSAMNSQSVNQSGECINALCCSSSLWVQSIKSPDREPLPREAHLAFDTRLSEIPFPKRSSFLLPSSHTLWEVSWWLFDFGTLFCTLKTGIPIEDGDFILKLLRRVSRHEI